MSALLFYNKTVKVYNFNNLKKRSRKSRAQQILHIIKVTRQTDEKDGCCIKSMNAGGSCSTDGFHDNKRRGGLGDRWRWGQANSSPIRVCVSVSVCEDSSA